MTPEEIIAGNKTIAEFMDSDVSICTDKGMLEVIKYHKSWDWLMPVVFECTREILNDQTIGDTLEELHAKKIYTMHLNNPIQSVYKAVIEFIEWHNKQKA